MLEQRVEKHCVTESNPWYKILAKYCANGTALYNYALFLIRQRWFQSNHSKLIFYEELDKIIKEDHPELYHRLPAKIAQGLLRVLNKDIKSWYEARHDYYELSEEERRKKYKAEPRLPKYKPKWWLKTLPLNNQAAILKDNIVNFPKVFEGFQVRPKFINRKNYVNFNGARLVPKPGCIIVELIYTIEIPVVEGYDSDRVLAIDPGVKNLLACVTNFSKQSFIIDGKDLVYKIQVYNKLINLEKRKLKKHGLKASSKRTRYLQRKINFFIDDYLHKVSKMIIDFCVLYNITTIIIGHSNGWKQKSKLGNVNNKNFCSIPFDTLYKMLEYKGAGNNVSIIYQEESYTSKASYYDNDPLPVYDNNSVKNYKFSGSRVHRGLYRTGSGKCVNADINGALNIMRKNKRDSFKGLSCCGWVSQPFRVRVSQFSGWGGYPCFMDNFISVVSINDKVGVSLGV